MKKVIVLAALLVLIAAPAMSASIVNSAHDLSGSSTYTAKFDGTTQYGSSDTDRLCVFCHTPHGATSEAALWNRGSQSLAASTNYTSSTMDATSDVTVGDAPLCMTCHDGIMTDSLTNLNGAASGLLNVSSRTLTMPVGAIARFGLDFSDDHPVGFAYAVAEAADSGIRPAATGNYGGVTVASLLRSNQVWCSSCHNVHDPGTDVVGKAPFLRTTNTGSALCLVCHDK